MASYALQLGGEEVRRYRAMAQTAVAVEQAYWEAAGISRGATVADVGCGPGAVSVLLAEKVGHEGRVWVVDADPQAVQRAAALAAEAGLSNVKAMVGDAAATGLPVGQLDVAMLRHVLAHNGGREQVISRVWFGRMVVCIWSMLMAPRSVCAQKIQILKTSTSATRSSTGAVAMTSRWGCALTNFFAPPALTWLSSPDATASERPSQVYVDPRGPLVRQSWKPASPRRQTSRGGLPPSSVPMAVPTDQRCLSRCSSRSDEHPPKGRSNSCGLTNSILAAADQRRIRRPRAEHSCVNADRLCVRLMAGGIACR